MERQGKVGLGVGDGQAGPRKEWNGGVGGDCTCEVDLGWDGPGSWDACSQGPVRVQRG